MLMTSSLLPVLQEDAICNRHLWQTVDSREACHLVESQFCQVRRNAVVDGGVVGLDLSGFSFEVAVTGKLYAILPWLVCHWNISAQLGWEHLWPGAGGRPWVGLGL